MDCTVSSTHHEDIPVVVVAGEADMSASALIHAAISRAWDSNTGPLIVDLDETTFIDSSIMGVLVEWASRARAHNRRLPIVCSRPDILRLFNTAGLTDELDVVSSRSAASPS
jgi:anti-sigma B factor antagonist